MAGGKGKGGGRNNGGLKLNVFPYDPVPQAGTLQASAGEQVLQTDVISTGHDGVRLPALGDCPKDSPLNVGNSF